MKCVALIILGEAGDRGPIVPPPSAAADVAMLCVSVALLALSAFLLTEATRLQAWVFGGEKDAPTPFNGIWLCIVVGVAVAGWWLLAMVMEVAPQVLVGADNAAVVFARLLLWYPGRVFPAFCLASILPAAIAGWKFFVAYSFARSSDAPEKRRRMVTGIPGLLLSVINLIASIATIITYIEYHPLK